jgi:caffeoyl-CoA O-methyltransferase
VFHDIPRSVLERMEALERVDAADRTDGTPRLRRLRQIPPETGRFLAILAAAAPDGRALEVGTSAGYSSLWLSLACRATGRRLTTFEVLADKARLARETFRVAGVEDVVDLIEDDARHHLGELAGVAFCFLDAEKETYADCYELVVPNLVPGGLLVADNVISHAQTLQPVVDLAMGDPRVDAVVIPIGTGELVCRRT